MIWHEHVFSIAIGVGKKLGYLFRARTYFSLSNLLTIYKAQIRPSLDYCSHIWGAAAPTTLSILDAVQRRAIRLIVDPALTCHLQPFSHRRRRAVDDLSLFYRYSNGFCSSELTYKVLISKLGITSFILSSSKALASALCSQIKPGLVGEGHLLPLSMPFRCYWHQSNHRRR
nr:unnamed protein product [Callosobruchus chinensis]